MTMTEEPTPGPTLTDALLQQTEQVGKLAHSAGQAAERIEGLEESLNRYRRLIRIGAGLVAASLIVFAILLVRLNVIANQTHTIQNQNQQVLNYIADCTNPNGKCAKQGAARVEDAVKRIIEELDRRLPTGTP